MNQPQDDGRIAIEDAFPVYRKRAAELFDENMLLRSQVAGLKRQVGELSQQLPAPMPGPAQPEPPYGGPDLASQPPYPDEQPG